LNHILLKYPFRQSISTIELWVQQFTAKSRSLHAVRCNTLKPKILLISPPFTQLNTPYPAAAYLQGYLNTLNYESFQVDLSLETALALYSRGGLDKVFHFAQTNSTTNSDAETLRVLANTNQYLETIDAVVGFLQGNNPELESSILSRTFLPEGPQFKAVEHTQSFIDHLTSADYSKHLASLYIEDLSAFITNSVSAHYGFSKYAESLAASMSSFDDLHNALNEKANIIDEMMLARLQSAVEHCTPEVVLLTTPFPGNVYAALRMGKWLKSNHPDVIVVWGGGYVNTELRALKDQRVFEFVDFICLDDGEAPLRILLEHIEGHRLKSDLKRTYVLDGDQVAYINSSIELDVPQRETGTPDYSDLWIDQYISMLSMPNPMHRLWNDGYWNKLTLAHGCYWGKCTFCDVSLDYIGRYEPIDAALICDRMEAIMIQTGRNTFHFVDEAAPPALMRDVAIEILNRDLDVVWWTNIRFEKNFTYDLCFLLNASGCIAISGGLEVASDRLLQLIDKGVTVAQVAEVTENFTRNNMLVHAYLMYGFPSQTEQETIDSLEMVRQLFEKNLIASGFWHQFSMTVHSPIGLKPNAFGVRSLSNQNGSFANNDVDHSDGTGIDHSKFDQGLRTSLYNFMHGSGFDVVANDWFDEDFPTPSIHPGYINQVLQVSENQRFLTVERMNKAVLWLGLLEETYEEPNELVFRCSLNSELVEISLNKELGYWWRDILERITPSQKTTLANIKTRFNNVHPSGSFTEFWLSEEVQAFRELGLVVV
jgi:hypothetical protein